MAPMLRSARGVSIIAQSPMSPASSASSSASPASRMSRTVSTLGSNMASGRARIAAARSSPPHSLDSALMRTTISARGGRAGRMPASFARAAAFSPGITASSRSTMTASQASWPILASALSLAAGT